MQVKEDGSSLYGRYVDLEEKTVTFREILILGRFEWDLYTEEDRNERVATILVCWNL
jgi:hypothetical protein